MRWESPPSRKLRRRPSRRFRSTAKGRPPAACVCARNIGANVMKIHGGRRTSSQARVCRLWEGLPSRSACEWSGAAVDRDGESRSKRIFRETRQESRTAKPVPEAFLVRREDDRISVDRMDHAERAEMMELAAVRGRERGSEFRGWAILTVAHAASNGRTVEAAPLESNPCHADICLNLPDDGERRELQKQHSVDPAARAVWEEAASSGQRRGPRVDDGAASGSTPTAGGPLHRQPRRAGR